MPLTVGIEISPERRQRRQRGRKRQEARWQDKAGPVVLKALCADCDTYPCTCGIEMWEAPDSDLGSREAEHVDETLTVDDTGRAGA